MGVSPITCMRGAGRRGSRKISSAPPLMHGLCTVTAPSIGGALAVAGLDPQKQRLTGLQHVQGVQPHARLGAVAADEALDRAVAEDEAPAPGWTLAGRPARTTVAHTYGTRSASSAAARPASLRSCNCNPSLFLMWTGPLPTLSTGCHVARCNRLRQATIR